jgi:fluoride exporter
MWIVLAVAAGGALGAAARYSVDRVIELRVLTVFPWSTWTVNITGCFLAGLLVAALVDRHDLPP